MEQAGPRVRIGKYEIVALLGRGGMGAVHKAFDPLLERDVAIKVMLPGIADDPEQKQRFEREARAVARLTHPSVVTVFDLGYHTDGSPYIVMELLRGRDLLEVLRQGPPLSLDETIAIVLQVLDGLGQRPQGRDRPPGHQAGQRLPRRGRAGQDHGLRDRPRLLVVGDRVRVAARARPATCPRSRRGASA